MSSIHVYSEVGKLKKVLLQSPRLVFDAVRPDNLQQQLVDDVVWAEQAGREIGRAHV